MGFRYSHENLEFLKHGYIEMQIPELTTAFNGFFDLDKTEVQIKSALKSHGFKCGRPVGVEKGTFRSFTKEQADFVIEYYKQLSLVELTKAFNNVFKLDKTVQQIRCFTRNHSIKSGRTGQYSKGLKPWNSGTKGICKPNSGSFKKGDNPKNINPIGHERICNKDGYILVKIAEPNPYTSAKTRYRHKHLFIWEKANGKVQPGMVVTFKDGNKLNCDLDNLIVISRAENLYLNRHGYKDLPDELKPSMLALAKLETKRFELIKDKS